MTRRDEKDPALTAKEKTRLRRKLDREWLPGLAPSEAKCMVFLFNMVTDWGKSRDRVKQDHFVNGTKSQAGTGLSLRTVIRALASLTDKGVVTRLRTPRGYVFTINFDWNPEVKTRASEPLSEPASAPENSSVVCHVGTSRYANLADPITQRIPFQKIPLSNRSSSDGAPSKIRRKLPAKRNAYVDPLDRRKLRAIFEETFAATFHEHPVSSWGQREEAQACKFVNVTDKAMRAVALEVLRWSIQSWRLVMVSRFAWMTDSPPPEYPSIAFMVRFREHFFDAWRDRERLRLDMEAKPEQRRIRKMMHYQGLSPEEASQKVAADSKEADLLDKLAKARSQRDAAYRRAEAAATTMHRKPLQPGLPLPARQPRPFLDMSKLVNPDDDF